MSILGSNNAEGSSAPAPTVGNGTYLQYSTSNATEAETGSSNVDGLVSHGPSTAQVLLDTLGLFLQQLILSSLNRLLSKSQQILGLEHKVMH